MDATKVVLVMSAILATMSPTQTAVTAEPAVSCTGSTWPPAFENHVYYSNGSEYIGYSEVRLFGWTRCDVPDGDPVNATVTVTLEHSYLGIWIPSEDNEGAAAGRDWVRAEPVDASRLCPKAQSTTWRNVGTHAGWNPAVLWITGGVDGYDEFTNITTSTQNLCLPHTVIHDRR
ncbi:MAG: hypothetical protein ACLGH3_07015 [Actinomycetota bacterium]